MATEYVLYKRYEKCVGKGKWPEITKMYLSEIPPILELTRNVDEAMKFDEQEAKELAYMVCMDVESVDQ